MVISQCLIALATPDIIYCDISFSGPAWNVMHSTQLLAFWHCIQYRVGQRRELHPTLLSSSAILYFSSSQYLSKPSLCRSDSGFTSLQLSSAGNGLDQIMTSIIWCSWKIRTLICICLFRNEIHENTEMHFTALGKQSILEELKLNPYWTELWHTKPTGFNTSTHCRETDFLHY
jgi:hypothetical protein